MTFIICRDQTWRSVTKAQQMLLQSRLHMWQQSHHLLLRQTSYWSPPHISASWEAPKWHREEYWWYIDIHSFIYFNHKAFHLSPNKSIARTAWSFFSGSRAAIPHLVWSSFEVCLVTVRLVYAASEFVQRSWSADADLILKEHSVLLSMLKTVV